MKEVTFDDLVEVAVDACKDGLGHIKLLTSWQLGLALKESSGNSREYYILRHLGSDRFMEVIRYVEHLRKEEFIIENNDYVVEVGDTFIQNGVETTLTPYLISKLKGSPLFAIVGAKVKRKKDE